MITTTQQVITALYVAFYNRAPDKAGLAYWEQRAGGGSEVDVFSEIAAGFAAHPKFTELYGSLDNQQFVEDIYVNVLGHAGDSKGISHWIKEITEKGVQRSQMVFEFVYSALTFDVNDAQWDSLTDAEKAAAQNRHDTVTNKVTAALAFVDTYGDATNISSSADLDNDPAYLASIVALSNIDETPASIDVAAARLSLPGDAIVIDASTEADTTTDTTAPFFITSSTARAIDENSGAGQVIYKAHAEDTGTITYRLKPGDDSALLSIDGVTGEVSLRANPDYEGKSGYSFTVIATDENANSSEKAVSLAINNLTDTTPLPSADTTAPTANLTAATDNVGGVTGPLSAGDTTDDTALVLSGTNEAGASVQVYNGTTLLGAASVSGTSWSYSATVANGVTYQFNVKETDAAGNTSGASSNFAVTGDTAAPTTTISGASYNATTDTLTFTGTNMASLLSGAETTATDLKTNFDWIKLQWDVDSDDTGNITFTEADIASAKATDGTTLDIAFTTDKAAALEATAGFDPLDTNDTLEVGAGFTGDTAGNAATSDVFDGPFHGDTSVVVFDLVGGTSSDHSGRTFQAGTSYTIYIRVDSDSSALATDANSGAGSWGTWASAAALSYDDKVVLVGTGTPVLGYHAAPVSSLTTTGSVIYWLSDNGGGAAFLNVYTAGASFVRTADAGSDIRPLWDSSWASNPNAYRPLSEVYLVGIPAGVLTSQGLA